MFFGDDSDKKTAQLLTSGEMAKTRVDPRNPNSRRDVFYRPVLADEVWSVVAVKCDISQEELCGDMKDATLVWHMFLKDDLLAEKIGYGGAKFDMDLTHIPVVQLAAAVVGGENAASASAAAEEDMTGMIQLFHDCRLNVVLCSSTVT